MNAAGRAGRAALETEGVVVLARQATFSLKDFDELDPRPEELTAVSALTSSAVLETIAAIEIAVRDSQDAIFLVSEGTVASFIAFIWFIAAELERLDSYLADDQLLEWLESTLAWRQLDSDQRASIASVAKASRAAYSNTDSIQRRRWARAGAPLSVAAAIDNISRELSEIEFDPDDEEALIDVLLRMLAQGRLQQLLELPGRASVVVKSRRSGGHAVPLEISELLRLWVGGYELPEIGDQVLQEVDNPGYRAEQLADLIADVFETHLPWALGVAISWANEVRESSDSGIQPLPLEVTALIKWGVDSREAVQLLANGVNSRRLAHAIVSVWSHSDSEQEVMEWLRVMSLRDWRTYLAASAVEVINLLQVLRIQGTGVLHRLLSGEEVFVDLIAESDAISPATAVIESLDDESPPGLGVYVDHEIVASIPTWHHADIAALLDTGLDYAARVTTFEGTIGIAVRLNEPEPG